MNTRSAVYNKTINQLVSLLSRLSDATAIGFVYQIYARSIQWCDPAQITEICKQINVRSGYLSLSAGLIQSVISILRRHPRDSALSQFVNHRIYPVWKESINIVGMHAFLLEFFLFIYTEIARRRHPDSSSEVSMSNLAFALLCMAAAQISVISPQKLRNHLLRKIYSHVSISRLNKIRTEQLLNGFFEMLRGFSACRGTVANIEKMIDLALKSNIVYSLPGMYVRYIPSTLWGILSGYMGAAHFPLLSVDAEITTAMVEINERIVNKLVSLINKFFWSFVFAYFTSFLISGEESPHKEIQSILFSLLVLLNIAHCVYDNCCESIPEVLRTPEEASPFISESKTSESATPILEPTETTSSGMFEQFSWSQVSSATSSSGMFDEFTWSQGSSATSPALSSTVIDLPPVPSRIGFYKNPQLTESATLGSAPIASSMSDEFTWQQPSSVTSSALSSTRADLSSVPPQIGFLSTMNKRNNNKPSSTKTSQPSYHH